MAKSLELPTYIESYWNFSQYGDSDYLFFATLRPKKNQQHNQSLFLLVSFLLLGTVKYLMRDIKILAKFLQNLIVNFTS